MRRKLSSALERRIDRSDRMRPDENASRPSRTPRDASSIVRIDRFCRDFPYHQADRAGPHVQDGHQFRGLSARSVFGHITLACDFSTHPFRVRNQAIDVQRMPAAA